MTLTEAVARIADLQRQSGALKRLFGRFPREAVASPDGAPEAGPGREASHAAPGEPQP
ncbi:hypothetical protein [Corallococcus sp. 4LFB]|uniref:hypothetical protein n=1 Tax=Corallococcus sp. 4LFB TaxID=3383249 RepID=UPI0039763F97